MNEAGDRIRDLLELGVNFQRDEDGTLHRVREEAQQQPHPAREGRDGP